MPTNRSILGANFTKGNPVTNKQPDTANTRAKDYPFTPKIELEGQGELPPKKIEITGSHVTGEWYKNAGSALVEITQKMIQSQLDFANLYPNNPDIQKEARENVERLNKIITNL